MTGVVGEVRSRSFGGHVVVALLGDGEASHRCHAADVVGEGLLEQLAVDGGQTATSDLAEVEALLKREHQRLDGGAEVAGSGVVVAVPVCACGEGATLCAVDTEDLDARTTHGIHVCVGSRSRRRR